MAGRQNTAEELQEAMEALERHGGNQCQAADELGLPRATFQNRVRCAERKVDASKQRVRELQSLVASQQRRIEELTKSKFKLPTAKIAKGSKGSFIRLVVPDTHGAHADDQAMAALFGDLTIIGSYIRQAVWLGDHLDCGGFLAQHHTLGYVADAEYTFVNDVVAANLHLDRVQELCPKAEHYYLEGNHERRIERFCITQALRNASDASYLRKLFSVSAVLNLDKRGIRLYEQGKFYEGCRVPSTLKLGHCFFTHGVRAGVYAARMTLKDFGGCVVFGHVHKMQSHSTRTVKDGEIAAWCPGCLCRLQPLWNHTQITDWSHGYAIQFVQESGDFLHLNIPIIDGVSYLTPMLAHMK